MLPLGTQAPDFSLPDVVSGKVYSLASFKGRKALLVMFLCRHCPYVQHIKDELSKLGNDYRKQPVGIIAISANDAEHYPDDAPDRLKALAQEQGFAFPFCYDATQETAKAYTAACTPDFFLFGGDQQLVYPDQVERLFLYVMGVGALPALVGDGKVVLVLAFSGEFHRRTMIQSCGAAG